jgi:hypothetical protein
VRVARRFRVRKPHVIHQTFDGEVVIVNLETGIYYSVLHSGTDIWRSIERSATVDDIVVALQVKYDGSRETLERAVTGFLEHLGSEGLIEVRAAEAACGPDASPAPSGATSAVEPMVFQSPVLERHEDMRDLILLDPVYEVEEPDP